MVTGTNLDTEVGEGQLSVSNGELRTSTRRVGADFSAQGTVTMAGGVIACTKFILGATNCFSAFITSRMTISGGSLYVTNVTGDASFRVCGTLTINAGTVVADRLV